jgi:hypothetical protein
MVKQAEKIEQGNVTKPILGLIIAGGLAVAAFFLIDIVLNYLPQFKAAVNGMGNVGLGRFLVGFAIWLILVTIGAFISAIVAGDDPKNIKVPERPRPVKKKKIDWK